MNDDGLGSRATSFVADERPSLRRRRAGLVLAVVALGTSLLLVLPWCDVLLGNVVPVLQALAPVWLVVALVVIVLGLVVRTRAVAFALVPLLLSGGGVVALLSRQPHPPDVVAAAGERTLRVMSLNAEFGDAQADSVMRAVRTARPDVLVFVEMTAAKLARLDAAGLTALLPHRTSGMIDDGSRGSVILSRYPLTTTVADRDLGPYDLQSPSALVRAPVAEVAVLAVHTYPPLRDGVEQWRPQQERAGRRQQAETTPHLVMAGDFNASIMHPAFRAASRGLVDAYPSVHGGWAPTWPQGSWMTPFAQIDHVLTRGFVPEQVGILSVAGTDHAAVWSELRY